MQPAAHVTSGNRLAWQASEWTRVDRTVKNLRQRIVRASRDGDLKQVRSLQRLLLRRRANSFASGRRVTQVHQGKDTPGVDPLLVPSSDARAALCQQLRQRDRPPVHPVRRGYSPTRKGTRPLGLPSRVDRCVQAMVQNALEPFWEARFAGVSYGCRPGRGCHEAIQQLGYWGRPNPTRPWGLEAAIAGAFDHLGHAALRQALGNFPARGLIQQWLKAGYGEDAMRQPTDTGVPPGGAYTSCKVAKNVVAFSTSIPREELRPGYGAGCLGAPLTRVKPDDVPTKRKRGGRHGPSRPEPVHDAGDQRRV